jgi:hypothetical protein
MLSPHSRLLALVKRAAHFSNQPVENQVKVSLALAQCRLLGGNRKANSSSEADISLQQEAVHGIKQLCRETDVFHSVVTNLTSFQRNPEALSMAISALHSASKSSSRHSLGRNGQQPSRNTSSTSGQQASQETRATDSSLRQHEEDWIKLAREMSGIIKASNPPVKTVSRLVSILATRCPVEERKEFDEAVSFFLLDFLSSAKTSAHHLNPDILSRIVDITSRIPQSRNVVDRIVALIATLNPDNISPELACRIARGLYFAGILEEAAGVVLIPALQKSFLMGPLEKEKFLPIFLFILQCPGLLFSNRMGAIVADNLSSMLKGSKSLSLSTASLLYDTLRKNPSLEFLWNPPAGASGEALPPPATLNDPAGKIRIENLEPVLQILRSAFLRHLDLRKEMLDVSDLKKLLSFIPAPWGQDTDKAIVLKICNTVQSHLFKLQFHNFEFVKAIFHRMLSWDPDSEYLRQIQLEWQRALMITTTPRLRTWNDLFLEFALYSHNCELCLLHMADLLSVVSPLSVEQHFMVRRWMCSSAEIYRLQPSKVVFLVGQLAKQFVTPLQDPDEGRWHLQSGALPKFLTSLIQAGSSSSNNSHNSGPSGASSAAENKGLSSRPLHNPLEPASSEWEHPLPLHEVCYLYLSVRRLYPLSGGAAVSGVSALWKALGARLAEHNSSAYSALDPRLQKQVVKAFVLDKVVDALEPSLSDHMLLYKEKFLQEETIKAATPKPDTSRATSSSAASTVVGALEDLEDVLDPLLSFEKSQRDTELIG